jgi:hypothetical protein
MSFVRTRVICRLCLKSSPPFVGSPPLSPFVPLSVGPLEGQGLGRVAADLLLLRHNRSAATFLQTAIMCC